MRTADEAEDTLSPVLAPLPPEGVHAPARTLSAPPLADSRGQRLVGLDGLDGLRGLAALYVRPRAEGVAG